MWFSSALEVTLQNREFPSNTFVQCCKWTSAGQWVRKVKVKVKVMSLTLLVTDLHHCAAFKPCWGSSDRSSTKSAEEVWSLLRRSSWHDWIYNPSKPIPWPFCYMHHLSKGRSSSSITLGNTVLNQDFQPWAYCNWASDDWVKQCRKAYSLAVTVSIVDCSDLNWVARIRSMVAERESGRLLIQ